MSEAQGSPPPEQRAPAPTGPSGCMAAFLILLGVVLLLPGLCAIIFASFDWKDALSGSFLPILVVCLAIAAAGIMLIVAAVRSLRR